MACSLMKTISRLRAAMSGFVLGLAVHAAGAAIQDSAADEQWECVFGATFPALHAMIARRHMFKYGTTREQLASVAVKNHKHGSLNPKAQF